jgi:hypothetical protein
MRIYDMYCIIYNCLLFLLYMGGVSVSVHQNSFCYIPWSHLKVQHFVCVCVFSQDCRFHELCVKVMRKAPKTMVKVFVVVSYFITDWKLNIYLFRLVIFKFYNMDACYV